MRRAIAAVLMGLAAMHLCAALSAPLWAQTIVSAHYTEPTTRYPHGVLGDDVEWGNMSVVVAGKGGTKDQTYDLRLPEVLVYEDIAPRLVDLDGDEAPEIIVVESHQNLGARLSIYHLNAEGVPALRTSTSFIGTRNRWLAPVGVADFDGDGVLDIALVDRPHLARRLLVFRYLGDTLEGWGSFGPVTNHRIGDDYISGGVRDCGDGPEMILLNARWNTIQRVTWAQTEFRADDLAPYEGRASVEAALECD